ncbi:MAG: response regulator transcription factor [Chloroflexi bacterium]|nr:response regulator transcription factor [Chloroflexota bacterium]
MTLIKNQLPGQGILVIDDAALLLQFVNLAFTSTGYAVFTATDGHQGLQQFFDHRPDLILLDLMLPVMDGWETCRRIRQLSTVPILMLTGLSGNENVIRGLDEFGVDDYLVKPVETDVLMAKIRALLRRAALPPELNEAIVYNDGYLTLNLSERRVLVQGKPVNLAAREYDLLSYLYRYADQLRSHQQILQDLWGEEVSHSVDVVHKNIWRLRQKLKEGPQQPRYILTEYGLGYRFKKQADP